MPSLYDDDLSNVTDDSAALDARLSEPWSDDDASRGADARVAAARRLSESGEGSDCDYVVDKSRPAEALERLAVDTTSDALKFINAVARFCARRGAARAVLQVYFNSGVC